MKKALITGITGQDGSYLAELLLRQGYEVHGFHRRSASGNFGNIAGILQDITLHKGDITDFGSVLDVVSLGFDEIYHEADQDNVDWSFRVPRLSVDVTYGGTYHLLESVKRSGTSPKVFIPCSAMMFGNASESPQNESTPFCPQSPYAVAKAAVYHAARYYREAFGMPVYTGILYNHDSPRRDGEYFLHKICRWVAERVEGKHRKKLALYDPQENLAIGCAEEFCMWFHTMLQRGKPDDYCIGTQVYTSVIDWVHLAFLSAGSPMPKGCIEEREELRRVGKVQQLLLPDTSKARYAFGFRTMASSTEIVARLVMKYRRELCKISE